MKTCCPPELQDIARDWPYEERPMSPEEQARFNKRSQKRALRERQAEVDAAAGYYDEGESARSLA